MKRFVLVLQDPAGYGDLLEKGQKGPELINVVPADRYDDLVGVLRELLEWTDGAPPELLWRAKDLLS